MEADESFLVRERPLLLNPCEDNVEEHLIFSVNGTVASSTQKGMTSIEILGLNRDALVLARRQVAEMVMTMIRTLRLSSDSTDAPSIADKIADQLKNMASPAAAYAGMVRQIISAELSSDPKLSAASVLSDIAPTQMPVLSNRARRKAVTSLAQFRRSQEDYSLENESPSDTNAYVAGRARLVEHVSIRNLRAISKLSLSVAASGGPAPWLMLLGENATGKSTVLQAIALALVGDKYFERVVAQTGLDLSGLVRRGADFGEISIHLSGASQPRVLKIFKDGRLEHSGRSAQLMVLAYGSTRLLPRSSGKSSYGESYARIDNLFDPFIPLADAQTWLLEASEDKFQYAALALKKALNIKLERLLVRQDGQVGLMERGSLIALNRLCDGYQTVIALLADILQVVLDAWATPDLAEGLVLLDEVGNHLHPSWKLRFVSSIREIMPRMQFIATTHEPLCLRGLVDGEVVVLRRGLRNAITVVEDLPAISGMRIDQILTSEHFGLDSTLDPAFQALFDKYYRLLRQYSASMARTEAAPTQLDASLQTEITELRTEINRRQALGQSERERLMLTAIDKFLATRPSATSSASRSATETALDRELTQMWDEVSDTDGVVP
ncbi:AAA family ATPase [Mesorhizobium sp. M0830]|uniref:AAA family ATPase n=1 Tax=Mesorhizobium sp. M0830 TaxID=2957008 RepID=UPI003339175F